MSNWIKTKDRMPTPYRTVLLRLDNKVPIMGYFCIAEKKWIIIYNKSITLNRVIAWCPIPEYDLKD